MKKVKENFKNKMSFQTSILDLPLEILEMIFQKISSINDVRNCQIACEIYTDPRISKILSQIQFVNEGKYLLTSEEGVEIVDLLNPNTKYELLVGNMLKIGYATGGLLQNSPIVCGGFMVDHESPGFVIGQPEMEIKMIEERIGAASVVLNQSKLWIVGGCNYDHDLNSTEFVKLSEPSVKGPDLPFTIQTHAMIQYDEKSIYIIGGILNGSRSNKTWIVDPTNGFEITEGPSLNKIRAYHSCAKMTINGKTILVVVGGDYTRDSSVEILNPSENNIWIPGPNLPLTLEPSLVTSPTGKGVIAMGSKLPSELFELTESMEWKNLEQYLQFNDHFYPTAIPIPNELIYEV